MGFLEAALVGAGAFARLVLGFTNSVVAGDPRTRLPSCRRCEISKEMVVVKKDLFCLINTSSPPLPL